MVIFRNIPALFKLYGTLPSLSKLRRQIDAAREAGKDEEERAYIREACDNWSDALIKTFGMDVHVTGKENLPKEGPVVFVSNHQGYADIIVLMNALDTIQFGFVAKDDLIKIPLFGKWILRIRSVSMHRDETKEAVKAILEGIKYIKKGFSLLIFPEGTRSKGPEMGEFKKGAFKLATKPKVPIVPVTVHGSYRAFEDNGVFKGSRVDIVIHPQVETKDLGKQDESALVNQVEGTIRDSLLKLQEEERARLAEENKNTGTKSLPGE